MSEINNNRNINFNSSVKKTDKNSAAKKEKKNKPKETQKNEQKPQPTAGSFGIIIKKKPSFGSKETKTGFNKKDAIKKIRNNITRSEKSLLDIFFEKDKMLEFLDELESDNYSDTQAQRALEIISKRPLDFEFALKLAKLNDQQYERFHKIGEVLKIENLSDFWAANIAGLEDEKYEKFVDLYNNRPSENTYLNTYLCSSYFGYEIPYETYSNEYLRELYDIFNLDSPLYEQAVEFLDKGAEPVFLMNIMNVQLTDEQKVHAERMIEEDIMPKHSIISVENDVKFNFALSLEKNFRMINRERPYEKAIIQALDKYAKDEKTTVRLTELVNKCGRANNIYFSTDISNISITEAYTSKALDIMQKIAEFSDENYKRAIELLDKKIPFENIYDCINGEIQDYQLERLKLLLKNAEYNETSAIRIAVNDELFQECMGLAEDLSLPEAISKTVKNDKARKKEEYIRQGMYEYDARTLSELYGKRLERTKSILTSNASIWNIDALLEDKPFSRFMEMTGKGVTGFGLEDIIKLSDDKYKKVIELVDKGVDTLNIVKIVEYDDKSYQRIITLLDKGLFIDNITHVLEYNDEQFDRVLAIIDKGYGDFEIEQLIQMDEGEYERAVYLLDRGINIGFAGAACVFTGSSFDNIIRLLNNGEEIMHAMTIAVSQDKVDTRMAELTSKTNKMRDLLENEDYLEKLTKNSQGKYHDEIISMFSPKTMSFTLRNQLLNSKINPEKFFSAIQKFSKSTFKLAYDTPNQYLSNIDTKYTEKVNGKYPELTEKEKKEEQKQIKKFFIKNADKILRALSYLDTDTVNQMMDRRTSIFMETLNKLEKLSDENYLLLSDLIDCKSAKTGKTLTAKEKIQISQIVEIYQNCDLDKSILEDMIKKGVVDTKAAKRVITKKILENAGFSSEEVEQILKNNFKFPDEYMYTMLIKMSNDDEAVNGEFEYIKNLIESAGDDIQTNIENYMTGLAPEVVGMLEDIFKNFNKYTEEQVKTKLKQAMERQYAESDLYTVVSAAVKGDFNEFIFDTSNQYGRINKQTEQAFEKNNINYREWLKPSIEDLKFEINNKPMKIKMWERDPYEDLFIGNKTSCCTAIGTGENGAATPAYLLSTSYNVVELYDEENKTIGMSRIFMADVDNKPAVIMDSIELNQNFLKYLNTEKKTIVRDNFFKYINNIAQKITGNPDTQVYFSTNYLKVPYDDLEIVEKTAKFIGEASQEQIYFNCKNNWLNPHNFGDNPMELYIVPK